MSDMRIEQVRLLIQQMPDGALKTLESALSFSTGADPKLDRVQSLVGLEQRDRRLGAAILAPIEPLCRQSLFSSQPLPKDLLRRLWVALKQDEPALAAEAHEAARKLRRDDDPPPVFDTLCRQAADRLRSREGTAFTALAAALNAQRPGLVEQTARSLRLAPIARAILPRLPGWLWKMNEDCVPAIRVAYRDAAAEGEDLAPDFTEMLAAHLDPPDRVLRLISAVMDRPSDRYLASSEMARFGERLLDETDRRVEQVRRFDPAAGVEGGTALAADILAATHSFAEFEQWVALGREGPWAIRLAAQKRNLALNVEARLKELTRLVDTALPVQQIRQGRNIFKGAAKLDQDPDAVAVERARGLLALLADSRMTAFTSGFGSIRNKVIGSLDTELHQYVEGLLDVVHTSEHAAVIERARMFLEIAAEFLGFVREPKAAEIVRRRAAAA